MYAALSTALGKVPNSRLVAIGTRSADSGHWFERLLKDADFSLCHAADAEDDPLDESTWLKACPQLKRLPHLLKAFREEARAAQRDPSNLAKFKALRLNMGVRERFDGVKPGLYQNMADRAELLLLGEKVVPVGQLLNAAQRRLGYPDAIACDRWRLGELEDAMTDAALLAPVQARGMGFRDGSEDVRLFKTALLEGRVNPVRSLLLRSAVAETRLVQDPAGNAKIAKAGEGNRRHRGRDDPAVAAVQAVALAERLPKKVDVEFDHIPLDAL